MREMKDLKTLEPTYGITFKEASAIIPGLCELADRGLTAVIEAAKHAIMGATVGVGAAGGNPAGRLLSLAHNAARDKLPKPEMPWDHDDNHQPDVEILNFLGHGEATPKDPKDAIEDVTSKVMRGIQGSAQTCVEGVMAAAQALLPGDALPFFKFLYEAEMERSQKKEEETCGQSITDFSKGLQKTFKERKAAYFVCPECGSEDTESGYGSRHKCNSCEKSFERSGKINLFKDEEDEENKDE